MMFPGLNEKFMERVEDMKKKSFIFLSTMILSLFFSILTCRAESENLPQSFSDFIEDARWSAGAVWEWNQPPKLSNYDSLGCCAFCADFVQYCFSSTSPRGGTAFYDTNEIRAGDVLTVGNQSDGSGHWFVCLKRNGNALYVAEGNYLGKVRIGWNYNISSARYFSEDSRSFTEGYHFMAENLGIPIDVAHFPDECFRKIVASNSIDKDQNGYLSAIEISETTEIRGGDKSCQNLIGVEYFTDLEILEFANNSITQINVEHNPKLVKLRCGGNQLTELDVSHNPNLEVLTCYRNQISSLDLSNNTKLYYLQAMNNQIENIIFPEQSALYEMVLQGNNLLRLDISKCPKLVAHVNATTPTISETTKIYGEEFSEAHTSSYLSIDKDVELILEEISGIPITADYFPDDNFRAYIKSRFDMNGDNCLSDEEIDNVKTIEVTNLTIRSLDGIEYFPLLESLSCQENYITELDVSQNSCLKELYCGFMYNPGISVLDISKCPELTHLNCSFNSLETLNLSNNPELVALACVSCHMTMLDITSNKQLETLACYNNELDELNVNENTKLKWLECENNRISVLDISNCHMLINLVKNGVSGGYGHWAIYPEGNDDFPDYYLSFDSSVDLIYPVNLVAQGNCGESIMWVLDETGKLTISGTGTMPGDNYWFYGWSEYKDQIISIEIQDGITSIGRWAFCAEYNLTSVTIPESVTAIGNNAFNTCSSLESVRLPDNMTSIGNEAFYMCDSLKAINLPRSLTSIGDFVFMFCPDVEVSIPVGIQMSQQVRVYDGSLCTLYLPVSLTEVGCGAFLCTNVPIKMDISPDFLLPEALHTIEDDAFSGISATYVFIPKNINGETKIGDRAFANCKQLQYIWISDCSKIEISDSAFSGCNDNMIIIDDAESVVDNIYEYAVEHGIKWIENEYYMGNG